MLPVTTFFRYMFFLIKSSRDILRKKTTCTEHRIQSTASASQEEGPPCRRLVETRLADGARRARAGMMHSGQGDMHVLGA